MLNLKLKNKQIKLQKNRKKLLTIFKKINKYWNVFFILILKIISSKLVIFLTNYLKKKLKKNKNKTKYWIRLKLKKTITYKPINLRMGKGKGLIVGSFFFLKPFNSVLEFKNVRFGFFNQLFRKFKFKISNNMCYLVSNFCKNIFKKKKKLKSLFKKLIKINNNCFEELIKRGIKPKPIILKIFFNLLLKKKQKTYYKFNSKNYLYYKIIKKKLIKSFYFKNTIIMINNFRTYYLFFNNFNKFNEFYWYNYLYSCYKIIYNMSITLKNFMLNLDCFFLIISFFFLIFIIFFKNWTLVNYLLFIELFWVLLLINLILVSKILSAYVLIYGFLISLMFSTIEFIIGCFMIYLIKNKTNSIMLTSNNFIFLLSLIIIIYIYIKPEDFFRNICLLGFYWECLAIKKNGGDIHDIIKAIKRLFWTYINNKLLTFTSFYNNWIVSTNHRRISVLYIFFVILTGFTGLLLATIIRIELSYPNTVIFFNNAERYLTTISIHGIVMVFFMIIPLIFGAFGNFLLPTQLGIRDVAFPRLNSFMFWVTPSGFVLLIHVFFFDKYYSKIKTLDTGRMFVLHMPLKMRNHYHYKILFYFSKHREYKKLGKYSLLNGIIDELLSRFKVFSDRPTAYGFFIRFNTLVPIVITPKQIDEYLSREYFLYENILIYAILNSTIVTTVRYQWDMLKYKLINLQIKGHMYLSNRKISKYLIGINNIYSNKINHKELLDDFNTEFEEIRQFTIKLHKYVNFNTDDLPVDMVYKKAERDTYILAPIKVINEDNVSKTSHWNMSQLIPGWAFVTPYSSRTNFTRVGKVDIALIVVFLAALGSVFSSINYILTYKYVGAPSFKNRKELRSFFVDGLLVASRMILLANPALILGIFFLLSDRHWKTSIFDFSGGGDTIMFQHLFWFFGHPEVYIIIIPCFGIINSLLPYYLRKRLSGRLSLQYSMYTIAIMSFAVWGHHMYMVGLSNTTRMLYSTMTVMISVPASTKILHWCVTIIQSTPLLDISLLYIYAFMYFFVLGGLSGMFVAHIGFDVLFHDTFYVIGHFHIMLSSSAMSCLLAAFYFYFSSIFGYKYNKTIAYYQFIFYVAGQILTFAPMFWLGYSGMPRRIMDYPSIFGGWNSIISAGHLITIISFLLFFLILIISLFDNRVSISKTKGVSRLNNRLSFYFYERRKLMYYNKKQIHLLKLGKKQLNIKKNKKNNKDYLEVDLYYYKIIKC